MIRTCIFKAWQYEISTNLDIKEDTNTQIKDMIVEAQFENNNYEMYYKLMYVSANLQQFTEKCTSQLFKLWLRTQFAAPI